MIFGNLQNLDQDRKVLALPLIKGLDYLKHTDFAKLADGRYAIDGDQIYAIVQEYQTSPAGSCQAETHRRYIDIQYMVDGVEAIGCGLTDGINEIARDLLAEQDAIFYKSVKNECELILTPGRYAIFFPSDIHRPRCIFGNSQTVKKVVVKVAADLLTTV